MKRAVTIFLQALVVLIGIGMLAFLLWEPHVEGRNADATLFEVYFKDPFLAYAYTGSIAFFVGAYQAFKALGYVRQGKTFSRPTADALRTIKRCGLVVIAFIVPAVVYLLVVRPDDDIAGGVFMGNLIILASSVVVAVAAALERRVSRALDVRSESDRTV